MHTHCTAWIPVTLQKGMDAQLCHATDYTVEYLQNKKKHVRVCNVPRCYNEMQLSNYHDYYKGKETSFTKHSVRCARIKY